MLQIFAGTCGDSFPPSRIWRLHTTQYTHHAFRAHTCMGPQGEKSPQVPAIPAMSMMIRDLTCGDSLKRVPAESPRVPAKPALWVSTDLRMWWPTDPSFIARDCQIGNRCYRRLDPEYFAWLKLRMHAVKAAADAGRVPARAFDEARQRFNEMQSVAVAMFCETALLQAVRAINLEGYRPPLLDEHEPIRPVASVSTRPNPERLVRARELVDAVQDQALALGWTMESLYFSDGYERRPFAARYGLICYIHAQDRIGEVTRQSIELIGPPPHEERSRFYNPDVEQPWERRDRDARPACDAAIPDSFSAHRRLDPPSHT